MNANMIWSTPLVLGEQGQEVPKRHPRDGTSRKAIAVLTHTQLEMKHVGT
jgi:hypothetical protein